MNNLEALRQKEEKLPDLTFTQENSPLTKINEDFSPIGGKSFSQWLDFFSKNSNGYGFSVLEIGGGVNQVAASQILERFPNLYLFEVEKREVDYKVRKKLQKTSRYYLFQKGFSEAIEELEKKPCFSIIFAHNVLNHLPNPFFIIEQSWPFLQNGGIFFANGVLIYQEEWEKIVNFLEKNGFQFSFRYEAVPSFLTKKGIVSVSFTIIKNRKDFDLPLKEGEDLTDFEGRALGPKEFFFNGAIDF